MVQLPTRLTLRRLKILSDAKTWVFNLRKDVTFSNGKTMVAEDVIASLQHHMGKDSKSAAKGLTKPIVSIKADGPNKVIIELDGPNAGFPFIASDYHLLLKSMSQVFVLASSVILTTGKRIQLTLMS